MRLVYTATFLLALILLISASYASGADRSQAEYLRGTIKSIPSNTLGTLDLNDPTDLVFHYGRNFYRLPFEKIKTYEISNARPARRVLARVPVPNMPWKRDEILNISFLGSDSAPGVLSLKLTGKDLSNAEWTLKSRVASPSESAFTGARSKLPEAWWGDRYWHTTRNAALWPSSEPEDRAASKPALTRRAIEVTRPAKHHKFS